MTRTSTRLLVCAWAAGLFGWSVAAGASQDRGEVAAVVAQVGQRVAAYYERAQRLMCLERSTVVPVGSDWGAQGFARTVESELRVEVDASDGGSPPEARVSREIRRINGRLPRDRDKTDRSGCTDPTPLSPEPLAFLLPGHGDEYKFTAVRDGRHGGRAALIIDFTSVRSRAHPELIEDEHGHDDCFDWQGPLPIAGRVWVDAGTHDVRRLERHLTGPTDIRVSQRLQRKYFFPAWVTIDRDDLTMNYKEVTFMDPEEIVLLPESIESLTVLRSGLQSIRRTQLFSDYRRFLTGSRIKH